MFVVVALMRGVPMTVVQVVHVVVVGDSPMPAPLAVHVVMVTRVVVPVRKVPVHGNLSRRAVNGGRGDQRRDIALCQGSR